MDEAEFVQWLEDLLTVDEADVIDGYVPEMMGAVSGVRTFEDAMVLTRDKGLVVTVGDDRFFVTIQKG